MGRGRQHELTKRERERVVRFLSERLRDDKLLRGSVGEAASHFKLHRNTISEIWKRRDDLSSRKKGRVGLKKKYCADEVEARIESISVEKRQTVRSTAASVGLPASTFWRMLKAGYFRRTVTRIKPLLTSAHMNARRDYAVQFVGPELPLRFHDFYDYVHINEKWFFIDLDRKCFYLTKNEPVPRRAYRSRRHLPKVMFLVAVLHPRWDFKRNQWFEGKIGLWLFAKQQPAIRSSKLRPKGTLIITPVNVDRATFRRMLVEDIIPAIKGAWPGSSRVRIQQDNASPHCCVDDPQVIAACEDGGWEMRSVAQPAQSPDFNVLDLSLFSALQSLQKTKKMISVPDIISAVTEAFSELERDTLGNSFLTLMSVMEQCLAVKGGNDFSIPHCKKRSRRAKGEDLRALKCSESAYLTAWPPRYLK